MLQKFIAIVTSLLALALATTAQAATITKCGASKGYSYFFEGGVVPPGRSGWRADGIRGGEIHLIQNGKELDIVFKDVLGTRSMKDYGTQLFNVPQPKPGFILVVAIHSGGGVSHHLFQLDAVGNGTVVWGSLTGSGQPLQKSGVYKATCRSPNASRPLPRGITLTRHILSE